MLKQAAVIYAICLVLIYLSLLYGGGMLLTAALMSLASDDISKKLVKIALVLMWVIPVAVVAGGSLAFYVSSQSAPISGQERAVANLLFTGALVITLVVNRRLSRFENYGLPVEFLLDSIGRVINALRPETARENRDFIRRSVHFLEIKFAIDLLLQNDPQAYLGEPHTVYISIPDTSPTGDTLSLPPLPPGWIYHCVSKRNLQNNDGTGWIPVNINYNPGNLYHSYGQLYKYPVDPVNDVAAGLYYRYSVSPEGKIELRANLESKKLPPEAAISGGRDG